MRPLRRPLSLALAAGIALAPMAAGAAKGGLEIKIGTADGLSRIEFHGAQPISARRDGQDVVLRFGAIAAPDVARLKLDPPPYLKAADLSNVSGGVELRLTLADGAEARLGRADGASYVNLGPAPPPAPVGHDQTPADRKLDPRPAGGVVKMHAALQDRTLKLSFPWKASLGAAVFKRGEAVWLVFDTPARLDLAEAPHGLPQMRKMEVVKGANFSAVRIAAPADIPVSIRADGAVWTLSLGPGAEVPIEVKVGREAGVDRPGLAAQLAGATGVFWLQDPVVGDKIAVVTALPPAKGVIAPRSYVDAQLLYSAQGLALQPAADDLEVASDGDVVRIGRPKGLALSSPGAASGAAKPTAAAPVELPQAAALPGLVDFAGWSKLGQGGFLARYDALQAAAGQEIAKGRGAGVQARLGLARFLVGSELAPEAIGVLNMTLKAEPTLLSDPEFRALRGAARAIMGRYKEAQADFSSPALQDDPASSLWRGYVAARLGDYTGARDQLAAGRAAMEQFNAKWRSRFARAQVDAALAAGDLPTARSALVAAQVDGLDATDSAGVKLAAARVADAAGRVDEALAAYDEVSKASYGAVAAPALLRATELRLAQGRLQTTQAVATLDSLRYRWRGDETELETVRSLGRIYLGQGRYREALDVLRSAGQHMPDLPAAAGLRADLSGAFRNLFLDGVADGLQPIQALALFYDYKEFTPIGADGDLMVRKLARRLVDVDLLDQAADLLKYQAENRLQGVARAEVATDLAMIQLMNRKPEQALQAINASRTTVLPVALAGERRVLEARAWLQLGQYDHALEILGKDASQDAAEIRAEAAWRQHSWATAGDAFERRLGDRWKQGQPLTPDEETTLLRAGSAYSLAGNEAALGRLRSRYGRLAQQARAPEAMRVALSGEVSGPTSTAEFGRALSDADGFAGWAQRMKQKFHDRPAPVGTAKPAGSKSG